MDLDLKWVILLVGIINAGCILYAAYKITEGYRDATRYLLGHLIALGADCEDDDPTERVGYIYAMKHDSYLRQAAQELRMIRQDMNDIGRKPEVDWG